MRLVKNGNLFVWAALAFAVMVLPATGMTRQASAATRYVPVYGWAWAGPDPVTGMSGQVVLYAYNAYTRQTYKIGNSYPTNPNNGYFATPALPQMAGLYYRVEVV